MSLLDQIALRPPKDGEEPRSASPEALDDSPPAGVIRVRVSNDDQGRHLFQTLRGHCEVDLVPGSQETRLAITSSPESGCRAVLRRIDAWQHEFGVESLTIELGGSTYVMKRA